MSVEETNETEQAVAIDLADGILSSAGLATYSELRDNLEKERETVVNITVIHKGRPGGHTAF